MTQFRNFMKRSAGEWNSQRRYIYTNNKQISNLHSDLTVDFVNETDDEFEVHLSWHTFNEREVEEWLKHNLKACKN